MGQGSPQSSMLWSLAPLPQQNSNQGAGSPAPRSLRTRAHCGVPFVPRGTKTKAPTRPHLERRPLACFFGPQSTIVGVDFIGANDAGFDLVRSLICLLYRRHRIEGEIESRRSRRVETAAVYSRAVARQWKEGPTRIVSAVGETAKSQANPPTAIDPNSRALLPAWPLFTNNSAVRPPKAGMGSERYQSIAS